jgi:hypothetical protein
MLNYQRVMVVNGGLVGGLNQLAKYEFANGRMT